MVANKKCFKSNEILLLCGQSILLKFFESIQVVEFFLYDMKISKVLTSMSSKSRKDFNGNIKCNLFTYDIKIIIKDSFLNFRIRKILNLEV